MYTHHTQSYMYTYHAKSYMYTYHTQSYMYTYHAKSYMYTHHTQFYMYTHHTQSYMYTYPNQSYMYTHSRKHRILKSRSPANIPALMHAHTTQTHTHTHIPGGMQQRVDRHVQSDQPRSEPKHVASLLRVLPGNLAAPFLISLCQLSAIHST